MASSQSDLCFGIHAVESVLRHQPDSVTELILYKDSSNKRLQNLLKLGRQQGVSISYAVTEQLDQLAGQGNHQGVIARMRAVKPKSPDLRSLLSDLPEQAIILMLDHIQDPHNLGACLRTAECAGVNAVILPKDGACPVNQTVRKVASGAVDRLDILYVANLSNTIDVLKQQEFWIYGTTDQAQQSIYQCEFAPKSVIIMGSEGKGLRKLTQANCDLLLSIPMRGDVSSLNVSVATGVVLFEVMRSRL